MLGGVGALVVGWSVLPARQRLLTATPLADNPDQPAFNGWVRIGVDDTVTVVMSRSEMGQGVHTALSMVLADELDASRDQVRTEQAPIDRIYNNQAVAVDGLPFHPDSQTSLKHVAQHLTAKTMREIGLMMTGGSSSINDLWLPMRQAGASARAMLVEAAASQWQVPAEQIQVKEGVLSHASGKSARFGELAALAAQLRKSVSGFRLPDFGSATATTAADSSSVRLPILKELPPERDSGLASGASNTGNTGKMRKVSGFGA